MKILIFKRESNDFSDILKDKSLKNFVSKITWNKHILLEYEDEINGDKLSYILLKFGDEFVPINKLIKDFTPVMGVDYVSVKPYKNK